MIEKFRNNKWLKIGLLSITGLLLVGGLVFTGMQIGKSSNLKTQMPKPPIPTQNLTPIETPAITPTSIPNPTANWKTYTSSKYHYTIKYPENAQLITNEREDFKIFIAGKQYPFGSYIAVDVLQNPKKLLLAQLGNERFATDAPQPYDLGWKQTQFLGMSVLTTQYSPPGDIGEQTIYLFEKNNTVFALWSNPVDEPHSTVLKDISDQILSTFKFSD